MNIAGEFTGYGSIAARARAEAVEETTATIFAPSRSRDTSPVRAVRVYGRGRVARDGSGRRQRPARPADWTIGAPLLRPASDVILRAPLRLLA